MKKKILPRTPSALIRLALKDLAAVERMRKSYVIDMGTWHEPLSPEGDSTDRGKCAICFAGSVMVQHLHASPRRTKCPGDFAGNADQLDAINNFRTGSVAEGLSELGISVNPLERPRNREVIDYARHKGRFKSAMRKLADEFEAFGL